uniref:Uncharacterized protein n=1 Tax=Vespula pensylvanica TaxID=30213 RepID=A0A834N2I6_VESPE|nr:hypothetical protein H0235_016945 [Vespula pensylvanica]
MHKSWPLVKPTRQPITVADVESFSERTLLVEPFQKPFSREIYGNISLERKNNEGGGGDGGGGSGGGGGEEKYRTDEENISTSINDVHITDFNPREYAADVTALSSNDNARNDDAMERQESPGGLEEKKKKEYFDVQQQYQHQQHAVAPSSSSSSKR